MMYLVKQKKSPLSGPGLLKILSALVILAIIIVFFELSAPARSLVASIFSPLLRIGNNISREFAVGPKFFSDKNKLIQENEKLSAEMENYNLEKIDHEAVKLENQKLREELNLKPAEDFVGASVIARPPQIPLDSLLLNRGENDRVEMGDLALASERILVGRIVRVYQNQSTVSLNSFAGAVSYGFVKRTDEPIEIKGAGGGSMEAKLPIDFDIAVGDEIMAGGSPVYWIGVVKALEEDVSSGFKKIFIASPVNISKTNIVFVKPGE